MCHAAPNTTHSETCTRSTNTPLLRETYGSISAKIIAYGHYHAHHIIQLDDKILVNVASIGMTYTKPSAWTLLEYVDDRLIIQQFQVAHNGDEYDRLMRDRNVPMI